MEPSILATLDRLTERRDRLRAQEQHASRALSPDERLFIERVETARALVTQATTMRALTSTMETLIRERVLAALDYVSE